MAGDQRYCLACGARVGPPGPQLRELMRRAAGRPVAPEPHATPALATATALARPIDLRLPTPKVAALLLLVFLGFGAVLGAAGGSPVADTLASTRSPVKLVLAPSAAGVSPAGTQTASPSSAEEAPPVEPEATPAPAPSASPSSTPAKSAPTPAPSSQDKQGAKPENTVGTPAVKLPPVKHVFVIMLANEPYATMFGPSSSVPYLARTLERQGELLTNYDAVAHENLANEVALISGQGPTAATAANCQSYTEIVPTGTGPQEQVLGDGCVYPQTTQTLPDELAAKHLTWRAYIQGIDEAGAQAGVCAHPALGQADPSSAPGAATGPYATFANPFVYFASIVGSPACAAGDVGLSRLAADLANPKTTPSFSYIAPDRCHDASPTPCSPGAPAGPAQANAFLARVVPEILGSKAYKESGLLVITTDQAPSSGEFADSSSCCGQPTFPNVAGAPSGLRPRGGGAVGALLLSPFVKAASTNEEKFNHFSLLRTIEDLFGVRHLGYAGLSTVTSFEPAMFTTGKS